MIVSPNNFITSTAEPWTYYLDLEASGEDLSSFAYGDFPDSFTWCAMTSAYQVEGAHDRDGRGLRIWDTFTTVKACTLETLLLNLTSKPSSMLSIPDQTSKRKNAHKRSDLSRVFVNFNPNNESQMCKS